ncbi:MAG TPA: YbhB/YbcL family Raf kinase inhibitor-like protein [Candidatus Omnitrophota bacterium]|nr:YbhB/YbcL family Raf kinase inhibitor-like protein [Candidatus Omnitrophota bacterium]
MSMTITSDAFVHEGEIPSKYTCQGEDIAPALTWEGVPENAVSLVLIVDDPDAPDPKAPQRIWVHWVVYNIPPATVGFPEGAVSADLPDGAESGINDFQRKDYGGPCPPIGRHRYFHKLYALDTMLGGLKNPTKKDLEEAMKGHILAQAVLMGTYEKSDKGGRNDRRK